MGLGYRVWDLGIGIWERDSGIRMQQRLEFTIVQALELIP